MSGSTLVTIRSGLVLHVWLDGAEIAAVDLSPSAALNLAADLLRAVAHSEKSLATACEARASEAD
jgi:hypothetical protein